MNPIAQLLVDAATIGLLVFGLFFLSVAALGVARLPDFYHRMHASSKGVTLGITGVLLGAGLIFANHPDANPVRIIALVVLVIVFTYIATPVGAHLLSKAAHLDGCPMWQGTLSDELDAERDQISR